MLSSSLYLFGSKVLGYGIRILLPVALVRLLSKEDFGAYNQFFLLEVLIQSVFQMGIVQSLFYFVPRDRENAGGYLVNSLGLNVVIYTTAYVVVWFFRDQVAAELGMAIILQFFWYMFVYAMLVMLNVALESYCAARQEIRAASFLTLQREVVATLATLIAAFMYRSLDKVFLALIVGRVVTLLVGLAWVHFRLHGFRSRRYFFGIREQVRYGIVLGVGGSIGTVAMKLHEVAVSRSYDLETYAVYATGLKQIPVLQFFSQSIAAVALAQFAVLVKQEDWAGVRALWERVLGTMYGVGLPVILLFVAVADPLVRFLFTSEYADAVSIFRINMLATLSLVLNSTLVLRAMDRNDVTLKVNAATFMLLLPALYAGRELAGPEGIIAAHALMLLLNRAATQAYLNRQVPVHLAYVASRRSLAEFYAGAWARGRGLLAGLARRA